MNNLIEKGLTGRVWKFGCNWNGSAKSFYDFIESKEIIIGIERCPYSVGDLVIITEGFKVKAIAKVTSQRFDLQTLPEHKILEKDYSIDYENSPYFTNAEWNELPEDENFRYAIQRGAVKVQKPEIIDKVLNLWNNKDSK